MKASHSFGLVALYALALGTAAEILSVCPATPPVCSLTMTRGPKNGLKCVKKGMLLNPSGTNTQPIAPCGAMTEADCRNSCSYTLGCHSFGFDKSTGLCTMATSSLKTQRLRINQDSDTTYSAAACFSLDFLKYPGENESFSFLSGDNGLGRGNRLRLLDADSKKIEPTFKEDFPDIGADHACDAVQQCAAVAGENRGVVSVHWSLSRKTWHCKAWSNLVGFVPELEPNADVGQYWNYMGVFMM